MAAGFYSPAVCVTKFGTLRNRRVGSKKITGRRKNRKKYTAGFINRTGGENFFLMANSRFPFGLITIFTLSKHYHDVIAPMTAIVKWKVQYFN